jgi:predicted ArsR family transcriptional regulator
MSMQEPTCDAALLSLLRIAGPMSLTQLAEAMEVTPTAVRYRLIRLLAQKSLAREAVRQSRGRPKYCYVLTSAGMPRTDSPLTDQAVTRWQDVRESASEEQQRVTLRQIARDLSVSYRQQANGDS